MRRALWLVLVVLALTQPSPPYLGGEGRSGQGRGVLRLGVTALGSLDPARARSVEQALVADQLFDSLAAYDPSTLEPVPALASRWEASPDQRRWTFVLREGAMFANGRPVTAADVKYSLERVARRGSRSPGAELLAPVSGYAAFRAGAADLAGVTVVDERTVGIALDESLAVLPSIVASPVLGVVPREAVEAAPPAPPFEESPVGSGPFRLARRDGPVLTLEPAPGARTGVSGIEVVQFAGVGDSYRAFTLGQVDWARVPPEEVAEATRRYGRGASRPYLAEVLYAFNLRHPKLADPRFREAIVRGIDRRAVVAAVYQGAARPVDGVVLDGAAEGRPAPSPPPLPAESACRRCGHDAAMARDLLAAAFPGGSPPEVSLDFDADAGQESLARAIQASLAEVGVTATLRPLAVDDYDGFVLSADKQVFRLGWIAAYPSPDAYLLPLFGSGSPDNLTGFSDPAFDARLREARAEPDAGRRAALFQEAERAVLDHVPVIPLGQFELHTVVSDRVRGLVVSGAGTFDASAVTVG